MFRFVSWAGLFNTLATSGGKNPTRKVGRGNYDDQEQDVPECDSGMERREQTMTNDTICNEFELDNRRRAPRLNMNLMLTQNGHPSQTINLSATGVRFITRQKVTQTVELDLKVGDDTLHLRGETRWSQNLGSYSVVGAHFKPTSDLIKLKAFLYPQVSL
jgi:hypothetical protein